MPNKVWDEITYPFPNFNSATIEVCDWISNLILAIYNGYNHLSMQGFNSLRLIMLIDAYICL